MRQKAPFYAVMTRIPNSTKYHTVSAGHGRRATHWKRYLQLRASGVQVKFVTLTANMNKHVRTVESGSTSYKYVQ